MKSLFDTVRSIKGAPLSQEDVDAINAALRVEEPPVPPATAATGVSVRVLGEIVGHESIVREWYLDSKKIGTWGVGVTNASGHAVDRYKDNPQPIAFCLKIYHWLLTTKYLPDVLAAFKGRPLTEAQLCAALSFHYNTGAIKTADWVESWLAGKPTQARAEIMNWRSPPEIVERREKERDLFFDGAWSWDGKATVYPVRKPSYTPDWKGARRVDIRADLEALA